MDKVLGIKLKLDKGSCLGSSDGSFDGSNDGKVDGLPYGNSLFKYDRTEQISTYGSFDGSDEETGMGSSDGVFNITRDIMIEGS